MKASDYIEGLRELIREHGDLEIVDTGYSYLDMPEFYDPKDDEPDSDGECVFVVTT